MLKIAHLTSAHHSSDIRIFQKECRSLARAGYTVTLVVPHTDDEVVDGVRIKAVPRREGKLSRMTLTVWRIYWEAVRQEADVYHFHDPELIPVGLLLRMRGKKVIYDIHEDVPRDIEIKNYIPGWLRRPLAWLIEPLENAACRWFSALVPATDAIGERFRSLHGKPIVVLHNYPVHEEFAPQAQTAWSQRARAVAHVGGIDLNRALREMVQAMDCLPARLEARLKLAGSFSFTRDRDEVAHLAGWQRVEELGELKRAGVRDLLTRVRAGLVLCHPAASHFWSEPNKLFEYMSAGIPVVAADFPLWRQIVEGAGCGILVDPLDPKAIAQAIEYVLTRPEEAETMGRRGRKAVEDRYNWKSEERKLLQLYAGLGEALCAKPRARARVCVLTSVHDALDVRIFYKECISLARSGYEVTLVAPHSKDEVVDGVQIKAIPAAKGRLHRMTLTMWRVCRKAVRQAADVYHFHDPELIPLGLLLMACGRKVIYDIHEDVPRSIYYKDYIPGWVRRPMAWLVGRVENWACRHFSALITATPTIAERFSNLNSNTVVVHNYVLLQQFDPPVPGTWNQRPRALAYVTSAVSRVRGVCELVQAMGLLPEQLGATLELIGPPESQSLLEELARQPGWKRVHFLGVTDRTGVAEVLRRVRAGLVLGHPELNYLRAKPVKLFEYMCSGIPVIAANFPVWQEIVEGAGCGLVADPLNPNALAQAIEYVLTHPEEAEAMGRRGRKAVESQYNWALEERKLLQLYACLVAAGSAREVASVPPEPMLNRVDGDSGQTADSDESRVSILRLTEKL